MSNVPTPTQCRVLRSVLIGPAHRIAQTVRKARTTETVFSWEDVDGEILSERMVDACIQKGWLETSNDYPYKPKSWTEVMERQTHSKLHITDAGKAALQSKAALLRSNRKR